MYWDWSQRIIERVAGEVNASCKKNSEKIQSAEFMTYPLAKAKVLQPTKLRCDGPVLASLAVAVLAACTVAGAPAWKVAVFPSGAEFSLEIAADDAARARGYMFRERVGPHEGMLFFFDEPGHHSIWMKNCKVSLDIIWLDAAFRVADIAHDLQPCPREGRCPSSIPMRSASYVLEVAGGTARREGLEPGDVIVLLEEPRRD